MSIFGVQGLPLEVTVVGCCNLDDKEWLSRQDPYVSLEYGGAKYRTKTCTDGGRNPTFQEKFIFTLIEGLRELNVTVWNNRTLSADEQIGSGRIQLQKVLSQGYDDASWPLQSKAGRHSGEVRLILHYSNANNHKAKLATSAPQYAAPPTAMTQVLPYNQFPSAPAASTAYSNPSPYMGYPPNPATYPLSPFVATPPAGYPPQACPPAGYPPQTYPPPTQAPAYYPTGPSGVYPPPPSSFGIYPPPPY
ncbi:protein SRC2 homolog [Ricinus communis]|uniref:Protein binding protein, putative n=1 Tax=Ricinus communis TaxID=3988 RepID=B9R774_RICCO|nr:protein SRC2 homolog [Ricinus communis]EEF52354.1 protein binding protein, putative [Ricinus communis]|eukprot:XP_002510167.1 protein SRC2 homolog [Ricinus communis]